VRGIDRQLFEARSLRFRECRLKQRSCGHRLARGIQDATALEGHSRHDLSDRAGKRVKKLSRFGVLLLQPQRSGDLRQEHVAIESRRLAGGRAQSGFSVTRLVVVEQLIDELLVRLGCGYEVVQIAT
jgi:hypothetical protein